jgi:heme exporter protein C
MTATRQPLHTTAVPQETHRTRLPLALKGLTLAAVLGFAVGLYLALGFAGTDVTQGNVQRIFYVHVASFVGASVGFFTAAFGGIAYLVKRNPRWDRLALSGIEVGLVMSVLTLTTGMVWARPMWNTWWTWDPRLTSAAIMTLTYAAYLMLRAGIDNPDKRRTLASVYAILAVSTVILTFMITRIRPDTIHPTVIGPSATNAQGSFEMTAHMGMTLGINITLWAALITPALMWWRIRLENAFERVHKVQLDLQN